MRFNMRINFLIRKFLAVCSAEKFLQRRIAEKVLYRFIIFEKKQRKKINVLTRLSADFLSKIGNLLKFSHARSQATRRCCNLKCKWWCCYVDAWFSHLEYFILLLQNFSLFETVLSGSLCLCVYVCLFTSCIIFSRCSHHNGWTLCVLTTKRYGYSMYTYVYDCWRQLQVNGTMANWW